MDNSSISEQQVVDYLSSHRDFFVQHAALLSDLTLPHESGDAVSLVERQVSVLRERNLDMRHRLSKLLDNARDNDRLFDKTRRLVLSLLEGKTLDDCVASLLNSFSHEFSIHYTSLTLFADPDKISACQARVVTLEEARQHIGQLLRNNKPQCGVLKPGETRFLFPNEEAVASLAVAPLVHGTCFGLLAVGNRDPQYYRSSMGTLFLSYIAEVISRILPRHLHHGF